MEVGDRVKVLEQGNVVGTIIAFDHHPEPAEVEILTGKMLQENPIVTDTVAIVDGPLRAALTERGQKITHAVSLLEHHHWAAVVYKDIYGQHESWFKVSNLELY